MSVTMIMRWPGVTSEQYDRVCALAETVDNPPPGLMCHIAAFDDAGLRVTDVWESAEDFQRYAEQRLMPAVGQVGLSGEPSVEICGVHCILSPALESLIPAVKG